MNKILLFSLITLSFNNVIFAKETEEAHDAQHQEESQDYNTIKNCGFHQCSKTTDNSKNKD